MPKITQNPFLDPRDNEVKMPVSDIELDRKMIFPIMCEAWERYGVSMDIPGVRNGFTLKIWGGGVLVEHYNGYYTIVLYKHKNPKSRWPDSELVEQFWLNPADPKSIDILFEYLDSKILFTDAASKVFNKV